MVYVPSPLFVAMHGAVVAAHEETVADQMRQVLLRSYGTRGERRPRTRASASGAAGSAS